MVRTYLRLEQVKIGDYCKTKGRNDGTGVTISQAETEQHFKVLKGKKQILLEWSNLVCHKEGKYIRGKIEIMFDDILRINVVPIKEKRTMVLLELKQPPGLFYGDQYWDSARRKRGVCKWNKGNNDPKLVEACDMFRFFVLTIGNSKKKVDAEMSPSKLVLNPSLQLRVIPDSLTQQLYPGVKAPQLDSRKRPLCDSTNHLDALKETPVRTKKLNRGKLKLNISTAPPPPNRQKENMTVSPTRGPGYAYGPSPSPAVYMSFLKGLVSPIASGFEQILSPIVSRKPINIETTNNHTNRFEENLINSSTKQLHQMDQSQQLGSCSSSSSSSNSSISSSSSRNNHSNQTEANDDVHPNSHGEPNNESPVQATLMALSERNALPIRQMGETEARDLLDKLSVNQIKAQLGMRELRKSGRKTELINRLLAYEFSENTKVGVNRAELETVPLSTILAANDIENTGSEQQDGNDIKQEKSAPPSTPMVMLDEERPSFYKRKQPKLISVQSAGSLTSLLTSPAPRKPASSKALSFSALKTPLMSSSTYNARHASPIPLGPFSATKLNPGNGGSQELDADLENELAKAMLTPSAALGMVSDIDTGSLTPSYYHGMDVNAMPNPGAKILKFRMPRFVDNCRKKNMRNVKLVNEPIPDHFAIEPVSKEEGISKYFELAHATGPWSDHHLHPTREHWLWFMPLGQAEVAVQNHGDVFGGSHCPICNLRTEEFDINGGGNPFNTWLQQYPKFVAKRFVYKFIEYELDSDVPEKMHLCRSGHLIYSYTESRVSVQTPTHHQQHYHHIQQQQHHHHHHHQSSTSSSSSSSSSHHHPHHQHHHQIHHHHHPQQQVPTTVQHPLAAQSLLPANDENATADNCRTM